MKYTPQIVTRRDMVGNSHSVTIQYDEVDADYVGSVMSNRPSSNCILAIGVGPHASDAADAAIEEFNKKQFPLPHTK